MPKARVSLPKPLYAEAPARELPVSERLREAIGKEERREELIAAAADAAEIRT